MTTLQLLLGTRRKVFIPPPSHDMTLKYCPSCKRNVNTVPGIGPVAIILHICLGWLLLYIPTIIHLIWAFTSGKRCPICCTPEKMLKLPKFDDDDKSVE